MASFYIYFVNAKKRKNVVQKYKIPYFYFSEQQRILIKHILIKAQLMIVEQKTQFLTCTLQRKKKSASSVLFTFETFMAVFTIFCLLFWLFLFFCALGPCLLCTRNKRCINYSSSQHIQSSQRSYSLYTSENMRQISIGQNVQLKAEIKITSFNSTQYFKTKGCNQLLNNYNTYRERNIVMKK